MPHDDLEDGEDWYDDDDEHDVEKPGRCPECGGPIYNLADKCPACGYWLSDADRRSMPSDESKPRWIKFITLIVLIALLLSLLGVGSLFF